MNVSKASTTLSAAWSASDRFSSRRIRSFFRALRKAAKLATLFPFACWSSRFRSSGVNSLSATNLWCPKKRFLTRVEIGKHSAVYLNCWSVARVIPVACCALLYASFVPKVFAPASIQSPIAHWFPFFAFARASPCIAHCLSFRSSTAGFFNRDFFFVAIPGFCRSNHRRASYVRARLSREVFVHDLCTDFRKVAATTGSYQQLNTRQTQGVDDSGRVTTRAVQFPKSGASANSATFALEQLYKADGCLEEVSRRKTILLLPTAAAIAAGPAEAGRHLPARMQFVAPAAP